MNVAAPGKWTQMLLAIPGKAGDIVRNQRDVAIAGGLAARITAQRTAARLSGNSGIDAAHAGVSTLSQPRRSVLVVHGDPRVGNNASEVRVCRMIESEVRARGGSPIRTQIDRLEFDGTTLRIDGGEAIRPEAVIVRRIPRTREPNQVLQQLERSGVHVTNTAESLEYGHKAAMDELFRANGIAHVTGTIATNSTDVARAVRELGPNLVLKDPTLAAGQGIHLTEGLDESTAVARAHFASSSEPLVVQPFHPEADRRSFRVLMMRNREGTMRPVSGMVQYAPKSDFRTNSPHGNFQRALDVTSSDPDLPVDAIEQARRAADAAGLDTVGVDLIWTRTGWKVLEINPSPGLIEFGIPLKRSEQMIPNLVDYAMWGTRPA